jgi:glycine cleavage system transcriptional repressor
MGEQASYFVLTAVGPDRPGLVNDISSRLREAGANLEGSRMAILGGEFAIILLLAAPPGAVERVRSACGAIEGALELRCILKETTGATPPGDHLLYKLRVTGVDRPGIVQVVTGVLAGRGINVQSLESRLIHAPLSGTALFIMEAELQVPTGLKVTTLRGELTRRCEDEDLDFTLESVS